MKNQVSQEIVRVNENTNVVTVESMDHAFGKPLKAGSLVVHVDAENTIISILKYDNGASKSLSTTGYYRVRVSEF